MTTQREGLTETEITATRAHFAPTPTKTRRTETGARYVVAMEDVEVGVRTRTVCRERGQYAVLDTNGEPVAEGKRLAEVLAAS